MTSELIGANINLGCHNRHYSGSKLCTRGNVCCLRLTCRKLFLFLLYLQLLEDFVKNVCILFHRNFVFSDMYQYSVTCIMVSYGHHCLFHGCRKKNMLARICSHKNWKVCVSSLTIIVRLKARLQLNIGFTLWCILVVFMHSVITLPKFNRFE